MNPRLDVLLRPQELDAATAVAIVVDVIRASTSLVTLVERGAGPIYVAPTVDAARRAAAGAPQPMRIPPAGGSETRPLLIGEQDGLPPEGFDHGNSPAALATASLAGRTVIFATTNGAPALHAAAGAGTVLVGCLRNASAAAQAAWEAAEDGGAVTVVCAGRSTNAGSFGVDDLYAGGVIIERILRLGPATLLDGAEAAVLVSRAEPDGLGLFRRTAAGRHVAGLGLDADVIYSAEVDRSEVVPRLGRELFLLAES
ncbi:MAG: 2-phosphosulfolactate phosphatase [bacterium]